MVVNFFLDEPALRLELNKFEIESEKQMDSIVKGEGMQFCVRESLITCVMGFPSQRKAV